jgi:hypothetical protein
LVIKYFLDILVLRSKRNNGVATASRASSISVWLRRLIRWGYENQDNERNSLTSYREEGNERERARGGGERTQFISAFDGVEEVKQGCVSRIRGDSLPARVTYVGYAGVSSELKFALFAVVYLSSCR